MYATGFHVLSRKSGMLYLYALLLRKWSRLERTPHHRRELRPDRLVRTKGSSLAVGVMGSNQVYVMATNFDKFADGSFASYSSSVLKTTVPERDLTPSHMTLEDLLAETQRYLTLQDQEKIRHAYDLANQAHAGAVRRSGEPYIQHPLEVALLLAGMRIDADGIVSALLNDVVEDTHYSLDELRVHFGPAVANIVDGVTKFDALAEKAKQDALLPPNADSETASGDVIPPPPSIVDKRRERTE